MIAAGFLQPGQHASFHGGSKADWTTGPAPGPSCVQQTPELQQWLTQEAIHCPITEQQESQQQQQLICLMAHKDSSSTATSTHLQHPPQQLIWHSKSAAFRTSQSLQQHVRAVCGPLVSPAARPATAAGTGGTAAMPALHAVPAAAAADQSSIDLSAMDFMTAPVPRLPTTSGVAGSSVMTVRTGCQQNSSSGRAVSGAASSQVLEILRGQWMEAVHKACIAAAAANAASDAAQAAHAAAVAAKAYYAKAMLSASDVSNQQTLSSDHPPSMAQQIHTSGTATFDNTNGCGHHSLSAQQVAGSSVSSPTTSGYVEATETATAMQAGRSTAATAVAGSGLAASICRPRAGVTAAVAARQELVSPFYTHKPQQQQLFELQRVRDAWPDAMQHAPGQEPFENKLPAVLQQPTAELETGSSSAAADNPLDAMLSSTLAPEDTWLQASGAAPGAAGGATTSAAARPRFAQETGAVAVPMSAVPAGAAPGAVLDGVGQIHASARSLSTDWIPVQWPASTGSVGGNMDAETSGNTAADAVRLSRQTQAATADACNSVRLDQNRHAVVVLGNEADDAELPVKRRRLSGGAAGEALRKHSQPAAAAKLADLAVVDQFIATPRAADSFINDALDVSPAAPAAEPVTSVASVAAAAELGVQVEVAAAQQADVSQAWILQDHGAPLSVSVSLPLLPGSAETVRQGAVDHSSNGQQQQQLGLKHGYESIATQFCSGSMMLPMSAIGGSTPAVSAGGAYTFGGAAQGVDINSCGPTALPFSGAADATAVTATAARNQEMDSSLQIWTSGLDLGSSGTAVAAGQALYYDAGSRFRLTTITSGSEGSTALPCSAYGVEVAAAKLQSSRGGDVGIGAAAGAEAGDLQPQAPTAAHVARLSVSRTVTSGQAELAAAVAAATGQHQQASTADLPAAAPVTASTTIQQNKPATLTAAKLQQVLQRYKVVSK